MAVGDVNVMGVRRAAAPVTGDCLLSQPTSGYVPLPSGSNPNPLPHIKEPLYAVPTVTPEGVLFTNYSNSQSGGYNSPQKIAFVGPGEIKIVNMVMDLTFTRNPAPLNSTHTYNIVSASTNRNTGTIASARATWGTQEQPEGIVVRWGTRCVHSLQKLPSHSVYTEVWRYWAYLSSTSDARNFYLISGDQNVNAPLQETEPDYIGTTQGEYYVGQFFVPYYNGGRFLTTSGVQYRYQVWGQKVGNLQS